ncbi:hypothetical protein GQ55_1G058000 [Panicum hallii var. hallii]|uniref:Uncharacterized protein n=1 Tax=Panicum hallii var. hallii TaxID=1504633 RepID=A0A2T7F2P0_9POAL|nr:hypothetical protein GQ55_1G058000 [Panicum hallii var. hallii]
MRAGTDDARVAVGHARHGLGWPSTVAEQKDHWHPSIHDPSVRFRPLLRDGDESSCAHVAALKAGRPAAGGSAEPATPRNRAAGYATRSTAGRQRWPSRRANRPHPAVRACGGELRWPGRRGLIDGMPACRGLSRPRLPSASAPGGGGEGRRDRRAAALEPCPCRAPRRQPAAGHRDRGEARHGRAAACP